jgi:hypothetical protein
MTRRLYQDVILSIYPNSNMDYDIYIVSDKLTNTTGNLVITIETLNGSMLYFDSLNNYHIADSSSAVAYTVSNETLAGVDIT